MHYLCSDCWLDEVPCIICALIVGWIWCNDRGSRAPEPKFERSTCVYALSLNEERPSWQLPSELMGDEDDESDESDDENDGERDCQPWCGQFCGPCQVMCGCSSTLELGTACAPFYLGLARGEIEMRCSRCIGGYGRATGCRRRCGERGFHSWSEFHRR
jgi:hypothetical protein